MISEEHNALALALRINAWLNPLAPTSASPHGTDKANRSVGGISTVVLAHNRLDSLSRFVSVVKWDCGHVMVQDVGLDDSVQDMSTNESEFTVDSGCGAANEGPGICIVVWKCRIGMLKEGNGN